MHQLLVYLVPSMVNAASNWIGMIKSLILIWKHVEVSYACLDFPTLYIGFSWLACEACISRRGYATRPPEELHTP